MLTGEAKLDLSKKQLTVADEQKQMEMRKMTHLKDLGVDLTAYLISQQQVPDKHYRFDTTRGGDPKEDLKASNTYDDSKLPIQVHLHE